MKALIYATTDFEDGLVEYPDLKRKCKPVKVDVYTEGERETWYTIEIKNLEELNELVDKYGTLIIGDRRDYYKEYFPEVSDIDTTIEIYDGWRE